MDAGSGKKFITLLLGVLIAYLVADALSNAVVVLAGLRGGVAMIVSFVVYAVIFFAMLHLLQKYAHIVFFGFGRE
jgi:UDP-N-acetylmuramyl pentapeptide phosphotransferase/UDP-N-acetylglucosamine-1-phosphate transferase